MPLEKIPPRKNPPSKIILCDIQILLYSRANEIFSGELWEGAKVLA